MIRICAAAVALGVLCAGAPGQQSLISGFDTASDWSIVLVNNAGQTGSILASGGNPGGFADLHPALSNNTLVGVGFEPRFQFFLLGGATPLTDVTLAADYRWFSGPALTLIPFFVQEGRLYRPPTGIALGTSAAWTSVGPTTFLLSSFSNSTGIPLNTFQMTQGGFMVLLQSDAPSFATAHVGIDNLNLQITPAPGAWAAVAGAAGLAAGTRRRRSG